VLVVARETLRAPEAPSAVVARELVDLTTCYTWRSVPTPSPAQFIEAEQPDRVRVATEDVTELELENPSIEGDALVGVGHESSLLVWVRLALAVQGDRLLGTLGRHSHLRGLGVQRGTHHYHHSWCRCDWGVSL
jgi:hypothetical protein